MTLERAKRLVAAAGGALALLVVVGALLTGALTVVVTGTGADPRNAFSEASVLPASLAGRVQWRADAPLLPRPVEPQTRVDLESAWVRAFSHLERAELGPDQSGLSTWFEGPALAMVTAQLGVVDVTSGPVARSHSVTVNFYSEDGQIVSLASRTYVEREIGDATYRSVDDYEAILVLSDGNWRIRHLERTASLIES